MPLTQFSTPLSALSGVALDTETTGLDARTARIVQIAGIRIDGEKLDSANTFERLINPGVPIPPQTSKIHGITDAHVANAPHFSAIAGALETWLGPAVLIGHTVAYDLMILRREYQLMDRPWHPPRALDIRHLARIAAPSLAAYDLDRLCEWLGIEVIGRHTAPGDALAAARVFLALIPLLRARNVRTLAEAEAASRRLAEADAQRIGGFDLSDVSTAGVAGGLARIDSFPYRHRVRDVMGQPAVFVSADATISAALGELKGRRISSFFVQHDHGQAGIVTESDMLAVLADHGAGAFAMPIRDIARTALECVADSDFVYRAIGRMERLGLRHLGVRDASGAVIGVVTAHRLLRQRATTALMLGDEIDSAGSAGELGRAWAKLASMARSLMAEDVDPLIVASVISAEIRATTKRAAELAEGRLREEGVGPPPCPYAVMVLGSGGRGESQLAADQDNAIVFEAGAPGGPQDTYFARLATHMNEILDTAGIPFCKGGVMAKTPQWRRSLEGWIATIDAWVRHKRPEDLLNVDIFFDAVAVHGDAALVETIWMHAHEQARGSPLFLRLLADVATHRTQPFSLLGTFRTDGAGRQDLKASGLLPIFTAARVLSIKHGILERESPARLAGLAPLDIGSPAITQTIVDAQRVILGAIIGQQLIDTESGVPLTTKVAIGRLDKTQKAALKRALGDVEEANGLLSGGRL